MSQSKYLKLNNGVLMPKVGLGVWKTTPDLADKLVATAMKNGYRLFDTAKQYGNETGVGAGVQHGLTVTGLRRENIFLTTKIFNGDQGDYTKLRTAFNGQLRSLNMDYVDLLLLHWPVFNRYKESWRALEAIYKDGQARAIGVCNFDVKHLNNLLDGANIKPAINQIEFNPRINQTSVVNFCRKNHIQLEAWSPLGNGRLLNEQTISKIAAKYNKSNAQIELRWALQQGFIVIPKTTHVERMRENKNIFDFELSGAEMKLISELNEEKHSIWYDTFKWSGNLNGINDHVASPDEFK